VFEILVGIDYFNYFLAGPDLWEWIKYVLIYIAYVVIVPFLMMLFINFCGNFSGKEADAQ